MSERQAAERGEKCAWCNGARWTHVGAGNYWECPICNNARGRLNITERERIEKMVRPLPPGFAEALDRDARLAIEELNARIAECRRTGCDGEADRREAMVWRLSRNLLPEHAA